MAVHYSLRDVLAVAVLIGANVVSVVGVVACNKMLYHEPYNFNFPSMLMAFHFVCTWGFVLLAKQLGWYTEKRIEVAQYMKLGLAQSASVGFVNLSLMFNTVGMYQVLKFTNILVICVMEFFWKRKTYSCHIYTSLITLVIGVSISTVTQIELRLLGLFHGLMGSVSTAAYQILNKNIQSDYDVRPLQLLEFEQPYTALFALVFALMTDNVFELLHYNFTAPAVALLLLSGVFAFGVNVTCYLIIGKTSPVTYGVVGHTKTVLILLFGFLYMHEPVSAKNMAGLLLAFFSIVAYTHFTSTAAAAQQARPRSPPSSGPHMALGPSPPSSTPPPPSSSFESEIESGAKCNNGSSGGISLAITASKRELLGNPSSADDVQAAAADKRNS